jgi:hypothetical protein
MPPLLQFIPDPMLLTYTVDGLRLSFATSHGAFVLLDVFVLVGPFILFILSAIKPIYR